MIESRATALRQWRQRLKPFRPRAALRRRTAPGRRGFTLVELMIVTAVIGVMAVMCIPTYQRAIEQSRADIAAANLRAIWAAERLYWLEHRVYTNSLADLSDMGLLDPTPAIGNYSYSAPVVSSDGTAFSATATTNSGSTATITIDQNGTISSTGITLGIQFQ
ncbi:MAG: prepilin-type N-terminal cleavage/methylation domain-containing protein [Thermoguttaceae bacterium]